MSDDPRISQITALINAMVEEAYARGRADALQRVKEILSEQVPTMEQEEGTEVRPVTNSESKDRKRAPRGSVRKLIDRVLTAHPDGLTASEIYNSREGELEQMIADSSIRAELRRGAGLGEFVENNGKWRLGIFS